MRHGMAAHQQSRSLAKHAFFQRSHVSRLHRSSPQSPSIAAMTCRRAVLRRENNDGSEDDIIEEDLYRYTRYRWIYNEEKELSKRYAKFDLEKIVDTAIKATNGKSKYCVKILKCKEGLHNKVLLMTMDDGTEVIAKPPNPNAGPCHLTTASEVATREFLREALNMPVPKIIGWSSNKGNPVGAEYILEEKAPGQALGSLWHQMSRKSRLDIISQVAELENRLASLTFRHTGCIYFRDNLQVKTASRQSLITNPPVPSAIADRFVLGPLITPELWDRESKNLKIDQRPWDTPLAYIKALGTNEIEWARVFAKPRKLPYGATENAELPDSFISLLEKYLQIAPNLVPRPASVDIHSPTLWHPDLHRDNLFVDADSNKITRIIDWQSAVVAPLFLQSGVPRMVRHSKPVDEDWSVPQRPASYDNLSDHEKAKVDAAIESLTYHKYYKYQTLKQSPRHWACLEHQRLLELQTNPVKLVTNSWQNNDVFYLREALMAIVSRWNELNESGTTCPISFSEETYRIHAQEEANINAVGEILRIFRDENALPVDGMVDHVDYDRVRENCAKFKEIFVGLGSTEEEKRLHERLWPYQDTDTDF